MIDFLKSIPNKLSHNFLMKLGSIALAFLVWLIVVSYYNPETETSIKNIQITNNYSECVEKFEELGIMPLALPEGTVDVKIEGRRDVLAQINRSKVTASVDVSKVTGAAVWDLDVNIEIDGEAVNTVYQSIETVTIEFQEIYEKEVLVTPRRSGEVPADFVAKEIAKPEKVIVSGPKSVVTEIDTVLAVVSKDEFAESGVFDANIQYIQLIDGQENVIEDPNLSIDAAKVQVEVQLLQEKIVDVVVSLSNSMGGNDEKYIVPIIEPAKVTLRGKQEDLATINSILLDTVDLSTVTENYTKSDILLSGLIGEEIEIVSVEKSASYTLELDKFETKEVAVGKNQMRISNESAGQTIEILTEKVTVTVRGDPAALKALKPEDIELTVDCKGLSVDSTGKVVVTTVSFTFPEEMKAGVVGNYSVTVNVKKS